MLDANKKCNDDKILCAYPFNALFLGGDAGLKFCCGSRTVLGNANKEKVSDIMNNEKAKEIREYMLRKEWHPNCGVCKEVEEVGGKSIRHTTLLNFKPEEIESSNFKLEYIDLRWNNTCNLTCNYCIPEFSHKWAKIKGQTITKIHRDNEHNIYDFVEKHKDTVTKVMILGGEPLLHKQNLKLTDIVPDAEYYLLTNLSLENIEENDIAQKFLSMKNFNWSVSFETIGDKFEYVRHGADWEIFKRNLKYLQQQSNDKGFLFSAHPLYFICSAFNIVDYYDFVTENNFFNGGIWWQTLLDNSGGGLLNKLSKKIKEEAIKEIDRAIIKYPQAAGMGTLTSIQKQLILDLDLPDDKEHIFGVLKEYHQLEKQYLTDKKYRFADLWPNLYEWLKEGSQ